MAGYLILFMPVESNRTNYLILQYKSFCSGHRPIQKINKQWKVSDCGICNVSVIKCLSVTYILFCSLSTSI